MRCANCEKLLSPDQDAFEIQSVAEDRVTHVIRFCSADCTREGWNTARTMRLPIFDDDTEPVTLPHKRRVP